MTDLRIQHAIDAIDDAQILFNTSQMIYRVIKFAYFASLLVVAASITYASLTPVGMVTSWVLAPAIILALVVLTLGTVCICTSRGDLKDQRISLIKAQRKLRDLQLEAADDQSAKISNPDWWKK